MRIFKRKYKDKKTGEMREAQKWYIEFKDHNQILRHWAAYSDKAATLDLMRKLKIIINCRITGMPVDPTLHQWLETAPMPIRKKLNSIDLLDQRYMAHTDSLLRHISDFEISLRAKGNSNDYVTLKVNRVKSLVEGCKFTTWGDISATKIEAHLYKLQQPKGKKLGISAQTFNFYVQAIKQFCTWMVRNGRANQSPVAHLSSLNVNIDRRHERRALTVLEMQNLVNTALNGGTRRGRVKDGRLAWEMTGLERALLYRLAMETGFRSSELRSLTKNSVVFDDQSAFVVVGAAYSKRKREDRQPLKDETADLLRKYIATRLDDEPLFNMPPKNNVAKLILRPDLKAAGIEYKDAQGRFADFHSLRHSFVTHIGRSGAHLKTTQDLARHSTPTLTNRYTTGFLEDQISAVQALPDLKFTPKKHPISTLKSNRQLDSCLPNCLQNVQKHDKNSDNMRKAGSEEEPVSRIKKSRFSLKNKVKTGSLSGGGGIRTHGTGEPYAGFQNRSIQPLWHPTGVFRVS